MRTVFISIILLLFAGHSMMLADEEIDRKTVVRRHNPHVTSMDTLSSLTVGNGSFAFTVDGTGLQTFPEEYSRGVPLGTMSDWGWHSSPNPEHYTVKDVLVERDFGRGHKELYAAQFKQPGRQQDAERYLRANPHRIHLGTVGLDLDDISQVKDVDETLDLWSGRIRSSFTYMSQKFNVQTICHPSRDLITSRIESDGEIRILLRFPYPTAKHTDDGCDWKAQSAHSTTTLYNTVYNDNVIINRKIDGTEYTVRFGWRGEADFSKVGPHTFMLKAKKDKKAEVNELEISFEYVPYNTKTSYYLGDSFSGNAITTAQAWAGFWSNGAFVDFSHVKDPRAAELERRVILSKYLMIVNDAGFAPPQETGLTYNSWFGKFHLEMEWWHQSHFPLWRNPGILYRTLEWYLKAPLDWAKSIAYRQGFQGARWMKMTDPTGLEAPSNVGSYLIWQQPHPIYLAELIYRWGLTDKSSSNKGVEKGILKIFEEVVEESAKFMYSFATYDSINDRYVLKGCIPAQETLKADSTINPPFELSYWLFGMQTAQKWRERLGKGRNPDWDRLIDKLSPLAFNEDSLYLAAESAPQTYKDIRFTSDHPAVLGALGVLPDNRLIDKKIMKKTLDWVWDNWNWDKTWGWDFPMVAMCAARLGEPERAVDALLMNKRTNTYLPNGHNYQDNRLRCYLPGNGGLLTAVAMMCAGWDGSTGKNPGFPADWDVRWEGLLPLP